VRKFLLIIFLLGFLLLSAAQITPSRYLSAWTPVVPGETLHIQHLLNTRPLSLDVWVALPVNVSVDKNQKTCQGDFNTVIPVYESEGVHVVSVNADAVYLRNNSDFIQCVQVVALP